MRESKGVKTWRRNEIDLADPRLLRVPLAVRWRVGRKARLLACCFWCLWRP